MPPAAILSSRSLFCAPVCTSHSTLRRRICALENTFRVSPPPWCNRHKRKGNLTNYQGRQQELSTALALTRSVLFLYILAMVLHPEAQSKAQAKLDEVIGSERLPHFSDRESLPYIEAIILECLKWRPITPFGFWHASLQEDEYRGYRIPAGSLLIPCTW
ncbi:cytochrome P450 [Dichomitus squalens]|nr:cytochrome P450 [Dichomitus squalens]